MIDNLIQLMLIVTLCTGILNFPHDLVYQKILPGAAISILVGNIFYTIQARKLAIKLKRTDITALPYGINTVSLFAYILFIMVPIYHETKDVDLTWKVGMLACLCSGIIESIGALIAEPVRKMTPRAALLSTLAGIAITFISMDFVFKIFDKPLIAIIPLFIILIQYLSHIEYPLKIPGGLIAVIAGTIIAWTLGYMKPIHRTGIGLSFPSFEGAGLLALLKSEYIWRYLSIIIPMGIFNVAGSLQNIESAEAAGDKFNTFSSLLANGIGSIVAAFLGSCFPTTIYIGHPGWKNLGARTGYSLINGVFITLICLTGTMGYIFQLIPFEAGVGILLWIGIIITAQAFQETPKEHALAVAIGLIPSFAAWGLLMISNALMAAGTNLYLIQETSFEKIQFAIKGMIHLEEGFIFTSMIFSAIAVCLIDKKFFRASWWAFALAMCAFFGIIHSYKIVQGGGIVSVLGFGMCLKFVIVYSIVAIIFLLCHFWNKFCKRTFYH